MAATVTREGSQLNIGREQALFDAPPNLAYWTVSADGQRFLVNTRETDRGTAPINVFVNWSARVR